MILYRYVWTDRDFDQVGWHDATVHACAFRMGPEQWLGTLLLDIDYILEWVQPPAGETSFKFWVAPATLAFEAASALEGELGIHSLPPSFNDLRRGPADRPEATEMGYEKWVLDGHDFDLTLLSRGFKQVFRRQPILSSTPMIGLEDRGGISFTLEPPT